MFADSPRRRHCHHDSPHPFSSGRYYCGRQCRTSLAQLAKYPHHTQSLCCIANRLPRIICDEPRNVACLPGVCVSMAKRLVIFVSTSAMSAKCSCASVSSIPPRVLNSTSRTASRLSYSRQINTVLKGHPPTFPHCAACRQALGGRLFRLCADFFKYFGSTTLSYSRKVSSEGSRIPASGIMDGSIPLAQRVEASLPI